MNTAEIKQAFEAAGMPGIDTTTYAEYGRYIQDIITNFNYKYTFENGTDKEDILRLSYTHKSKGNTGNSTFIIPKNNGYYSYILAMLQTGVIVPKKRKEYQLTTKSIVFIHDGDRNDKRQTTGQKIMITGFEDFDIWVTKNEIGGNLYE